MWRSSRLGELRVGESMAPELALINGKLHTQDPDAPNATSVAIADRRFVAVGDDASVEPLLGPNTRVIDLGGRRVLPGLTDAHFHFHRWAISRMRLPLHDTPSLPGLRDRVREAATVTRPGGWVVGQGWNETRWPEPRIPTRVDLDQAAPEHPVLLWRSDMHLAVANTRALQEAGIDRERPNPPQGRIDRDASGTPTGVLRELAINVVQESIPSPPEDQLVEAMREGIGLLHRLGLTGVHDHRLMGGTDGPQALRAYQRLPSLGGLSLRLWTGIGGEQLDEAIALGLRTGFGDDYLRVGHVKLFADGSQGARTAWMLEPYEDTGDCGMPMTPLEEIAEAVRKAGQAGLAVAVHAIGDRANRELITVFEQHVGSASIAVPHRIEHLQIVRPEDVRRLARLGMVASVQPIHLTDDIPLCGASIGSRCRFAYPFRDLLDAGVTLAFGSDAPVASPNPLWGIHAAVTRQGRDGRPEGGWYPEQRLTPAEAVWAYTMGPAIASGREGTLGSITPGKLADLVVLDRDILAIDPSEIHQARATMTIVGGEVVYDA